MLTKDRLIAMGAGYAHIYCDGHVVFQGQDLTVGELDEIVDLSPSLDWSIVFTSENKRQVYRRKHSKNWELHYEEARL